MILYLDDYPELKTVPFILPQDNKSSTLSQFNSLASAVNKV
jgi:hypothetical protein